MRMCEWDISRTIRGRDRAVCGRAADVDRKLDYRESNCMIIVAGNCSPVQLFIIRIRRVSSSEMSVITHRKPMSRRERIARSSAQHAFAPTRDLRELIDTLLV